MLSIGKIALGQHRYYEQQVAQGWDDYYAGRGEAPGEWVGRGADALGLGGRVSSEQFSALIAGVDPREPDIRLRSSERDPKVAALDLTFSAPQTVSVLAVAEPHLRCLITERLGLRWGPVRKGAAERVGVPEAVLEEFSKRRHEMLLESQKGGIGLDSKAAAEKAAIATRDRKRYGVDTHSWREEVRARAAELGLGTRELGELMRAARKALRRGVVEPRLDERALGDALVGPHGLTERANSFDERDVLQHLASAASSGEPAQEIRRRAASFTQREEVLPTLAGAFTTRDLVECERGLIAAALSRADENAGE